MGRRVKRRWRSDVEREWGEGEGENGAEKGKGAGGRRVGVVEGC